ncbi:PREDICTED: uncharacterized protein LOC108608895 [Drosophila arizonae]|uniref:Uncharacterized protein LOC108608895 n=1 Tax=Drosophila arizonae TaxID=7263 RepID=A0ABM1NM12_DROAR|nr:PREDICTED: uncharacterized protein LOC108608895 [Drosophila arizonae]XP_017855998.1 PREDICTED: uncharacterized protein LOC108608895 [Drosophila arizonae]
MVLKRNRNADDLQKRLFLKYKLKKVVREVIMNSQWLDENQDDHKMSSNVKKNIAFMMRTKRKFGVLTLSEKSLIRTPHHLRTVSDRKKLCILFAGFRCFLSVPAKQRVRVIPVVKFLSVSPGRIIIRKGDKPFLIYFIVAGEIGMPKRNISEVEDQFMFGPGDCIGDIGMFEDGPRFQTCIAASQCELLVLLDNDFNSILKPYMQKVWNDKKRALKALDYFDFFSDDQILKACKLCTLKQYNPLDTIYSHDRGTLTNVHFVLSGECLILQCLNMKVVVNNGKKMYHLVDTSDGGPIYVPSEQSIRSRLVKNSSMFDALDAVHKNENKSPGQLNTLTSDSDNGSSISTVNLIKHYTSPSSIKYSEYYVEEMTYADEAYSSSGELFKDRKQLTSDIYNDIESESDLFYVSNFLGSSSTCLSAGDIENHFIDVGSLTFGGIFGLGETMRHRVIMARSTVQCLLLPRFFLLDNDQNPGNIWQRRLFYLECIIPSRDDLFDNFLKTLKWKKFKIDFIKNLTTNTTNIAKDDDIPVLCRIEGGIDPQ